MSTFYGGPQLSSVTSVSGQGSSTFTAYTVPTGFHARIKGNIYVVPPLFGGSDPAGFVVNGQQITQNAQNTGTSIDLFLPSGSTIGFIEIGNSIFNYYIGIELYKNP